MAQVNGAETLRRAPTHSAAQVTKVLSPQTAALHSVRTYSHPVEAEARNGVDASGDP